MNESELTVELAVEDVMRRWPDTIAVFIRHRMSCVGCAIATFHTVADASREYNLPLDQLLAELRAAARHDRGAAGRAELRLPEPRML